MLQKIFPKYLRWANTHRLIFISSALLLFITVLYISSGLELKSSLEELLPDNTPSVIQLNRMLDKVGGISVLTIAVESPNIAANKRLVDDLNEKLKDLPPDQVHYVNAKVDNIRKFYEDNMLHFVDIADLEKLYTRLKRFVDYEKLKRTPFFINLGDEESPVTLNIDDIKQRNQKNVKMPLAVFDDYYGGEHGQLLIVMIRPKGVSLAINDARNLIKQVKGIVERLDPSSYDPDLTVGYCGNIVSTVEEYDTLRQDMFSTAALCIALVAGVITIYFLRIRLVVFFGFSLIFSILITFTITRYAIGYLNAQTAFLASIIIGTGINYGIIMVGRYLEERKAGKNPIMGMEIALETTLKPTFLAAATTAVAFLILILAGVKGLSQFGFIGSVGVICCWLVSMLFLPPLIVISEDVLSLSRRKLDVPKRKSALLPEMDKILTHFPIAIILLGVLLGSIGLGIVIKYIPNSIEYDFSKLRNKISATTGTEALEKRVAKLWIGSMTPAVVLLDEPEDGPKVCAAVEKQNNAYPEKDRRVDDCYTVYDLLPQDQDQRAVILTKIDHLLDKRWLNELKGDVGEKIKKLNFLYKKNAWIL
ncbi:MAG: MMPL family transporter [Pseudomonadota bacterium]